MACRRLECQLSLIMDSKDFPSMGPCYAPVGFWWCLFYTPSFVHGIGGIYSVSRLGGTYQGPMVETVEWRRLCRNPAGEIVAAAFKVAVPNLVMEVSNSQGVNLDPKTVGLKFKGHLPKRTPNSWKQPSLQHQEVNQPSRISQRLQDSHSWGFWIQIPCILKEFGTQTLGTWSPKVCKLMAPNLLT